MTAPVVSVIVVSDYASDSARSWDTERACFAALAAQDFDEPAEFILCEDERYRGEVPSDLTNALAESRVLFSQAATSYSLKNAGVREASAPLVALLDADCRADADWLRRLVEAFRSNPDISVVSGRTFYDGAGVWERVLCLLTRSYLDPGRTGESAFASNNAVGFRKDVFLSHPLPENLGASQPGCSRSRFAVLAGFFGSSHGCASCTSSKAGRWRQTFAGTSATERSPLDSPMNECRTRRWYGRASPAFR